MADSTPFRPRVVVIGGGMGGLATALALKNSGHDVLILERDAPPPEMAPESAFSEWNHPGVPQLRHTHIFLARLRTILRDRHPEFLAELERIGIERATIDEVLPPGIQSSYLPKQGDDDLLHLWGRRATFEYALRKYVRDLGHVEFLHDTRVEGLVLEREGPHIRVRGVTVRRGTERETIHAAVVVDASGVRSKITEMLKDAGASIDVQRDDSPCAYYCRHYALLDHEGDVPRSGTGAHVDYLVFGTFFAEKDTFSIAVACPDIEEELCESLKRPEGFDEMCRQIPVLDRLTSNARPLSRVLGGGGLANRWTVYPRSSGPHVLGFFPVGDSYVVTNPIYGRGCSMAFVAAHALADVLTEMTEPVARARRYHRDVYRLLRPHFDFCVAADKGFLARAKMARGDAVSFFDRLASTLYESILAPALEEKLFVSREWLKVQQMREVSPPLVAIFFLLYTLALWAARTARGIERKVQRIAPAREEMLSALSSARPSASPIPILGTPAPSAPALSIPPPPSPASLSPVSLASPPAPPSPTSEPAPASDPSSYPPPSLPSTTPPPSLHPAATHSVVTPRPSRLLPLRS